MDWFLEHIDFLAPLIFFIIYGISAAAKAGKSNDEEDSAEGGSSAPSRGRNRRDIQEEIRRRIMERMQEVSGQSQQDTATSEAGPPPAPFGEPQRQREQTQRQPQSFPRASSKPKPPPEKVPAAAFDPMADMQRKIREAQESAKEAETALQKAGSGVLKPIAVSRQWGVRENHHGTSFLSRLRADLATPERQQEAIVLAEVLGKPVSLRKSSAGIPPLADR